VPFADPAAMRDYQRRWVARRRALFFRDRSCEWCGATEELELHHRDPNKKVSHSIWSWGEKRRLAELAKCIVICGPCHRRAHAEARRVEAELRNPHGTEQRYRLGCRCTDCRAANTERARRQREAA
jgi:hypothetical protein